MNRAAASLSTCRINDKAGVVILFEQTADIANVMGKARNDHVRVIVSGHVAIQRTTAEYIVARKRHEERVLEIVVKCVAISNALQSGAGGRRHYLSKMLLRRAKSATHIATEKILQGARC